MILCSADWLPVIDAANNDGNNIRNDLLQYIDLPNNIKKINVDI